jgi:hypothetical protein
MNFSVDLQVYEKGRRAPQYTLDTDLNGEITLAELLKFTKASLIIISDQVLREEQDRGFDKEPVVVVDGRTNKPVISVNPLGSIEFIARADIKEMMLEIWNAIEYRSPVDTGEYKSSNVVALNGNQVANSLQSLEAWLNSNPVLGPKDIIRFVNTAPYARRLERLGVTAQRRRERTENSRDKRQRSGTKILAPNGTYFLTSRAVKRKFKKNVGITFGFIPGYVLGLKGNFRTYSKNPRKKNNKPNSYLYPAITLRIGEGGTL